MPKQVQQLDFNKHNKLIILLQLLQQQELNTAIRIVCISSMAVKANTNNNLTLRHKFQANNKILLLDFLNPNLSTHIKVSSQSQQHLDPNQPRHFHQSTTI